MICRQKLDNQLNQLKNMRLAPVACLHLDEQQQNYIFDYRHSF